MLTPSERRGAWVIAGLLLLGSLWEASAPWRERAGVASPDPAAGAPRALADSAAPAVAAPAGDSTAVVAPSRSPGRVISLNRATAEELESLPGIGPVLARRILEHRRRAGPFREVEELRAVRGVGPRLLERLRGRVGVGP